jgi:hypothetical protein
MKDFVTFENILPYLEYNKCTICDRRKNLNECNSCKDLFCIKCDYLKNTLCGFCNDILNAYLKREQRLL